MAVCLVMQFTGVDAAKYEAVMKELGLQSANAIGRRASSVTSPDSIAMECMWWTFGNRSGTLTPLPTAG
jgi:hypothetical protein